MKQSRDTFRHLDNATPHRAPQDFDYPGIARPPHQSYSQNLAPCDFWLFGTLKRKLEGFTFGHQIEMLLAMNTIFSTIPHEEFISVFNEWKSRLRECIDRGGEYLYPDSLSSIYFIRSGNFYRANGLDAPPAICVSWCKQICQHDWIVRIGEFYSDNQTKNRH
jgi:hypothetical protein